MPKDLGGDAATKKRKENNYRAKKRSMSTDTKAPHSLENLDVGLPKHPVTESHEPTSDCTPPCDVQKPEIKQLPTPLDASIPFRTQFRILTAVQGWLEEAIFEFFQKWLPEALEAKDIDVAEKVELTDWADTIGKEMKALPKAATGRIPGTSLMQELRATYQLRNAALKRQQLSSNRLLELLGAASNLVTIMKDDTKSTLIVTLIGEIQTGSRIVESRLEVAKEALVNDSEIIEGMKNTLTEILVKANKNAYTRCERNRTGVGITLDLFLDNTRKGSTSGGQMAIFEDELLRLQESQDTFLPQDLQLQDSNLSQAGSMQIVRSAKLSGKNREEGGVESGEQDGEECDKEDGKEDVMISSNSLRHAADGKAGVHDAFRADGSSAGTSSALKVPIYAEDSQGNSKDYPKAIHPLSKNLRSKSNNSASPMQPGSNRRFPFMASHSISKNPDKNQPSAMLDLVGDVEFTFKADPRKYPANAVADLSTKRSTEKEPMSTMTLPLQPLSRSTNTASALSSTQSLFGRENEQTPKSTSSEPTAANITTKSIDPSQALGSSPINRFEEAGSKKGDREQGSSSLPSLFVTTQSNRASGATTSSKEEQATVSPAVTSQPQRGTNQPSTKSNISPHPSSTLPPQAPSFSSRPGTTPPQPLSAPPTKAFKFARPTISQITRCFGTAESLPFNPLYLSERETQTGGKIVDLMLCTQSITFMMGHCNYSFEVCHITANE